jgi:hypothetical protein
MSGRGWLGRQSCAAENNRRKAEFNSSNATLLSSPVTPHAKKDHGEICGLATSSNIKKLMMRQPQMLRVKDLLKKHLIFTFNLLALKKLMLTLYGITN